MEGHVFVLYDQGQWCVFFGVKALRSNSIDDVLELELKDAAWYYPEPKEKAANIKDHVAFSESALPVPWRHLDPNVMDRQEQSSNFGFIGDHLRCKSEK